MNISEAQNISIVDYLASVGIEPKTLRGDDVWYCSPLRPGETKPSFKVNTRINKWKDFGSDGKGGDLVDLICRMHGVTITGALLLLESPRIAKSMSFSFRGKVSDNVINESRLTILHVQPLQNRALLQYLESRGISPATANRWVKEVYYLTRTTTGEEKKYFSYGMQNDSGGWALRNRYFKNQSNPADITTIHGAEKNMISVFEGMTNFLSACEYFRVPKPNGTVIILNSTAHLGKIILELSKFDKVCTYLDNDASGEQATGTIREHHHRVIDYSKIIFPDFNDINDFLISRESGKSITFKKTKYEKSIIN